MRRVLIVVYSAFAVLLLANFIYYQSLYKRQIRYITELLDRQVQLVGMEVDSTNTGFDHDLAQINFNFSKDIPRFFDKNAPDIKLRVTEQLQNFYSKYKDFVVMIRLYDNKKNEFTLSKDETKNEWLQDQFSAFDQREIREREMLVKNDNGKFFDYYVTLLNNGLPGGNIVVTVDYQKYFLRLFSKFILAEKQWQWVLSDSGKIIFDNFGQKVEYTHLERITSDLNKGTTSRITHMAISRGERMEILSSYYSTQLLQRDIGVVFSAPTTFFQKYIIRNSIFIVSGTVAIIQIIIFLFLWYDWKQKKEMNRLAESENTLIRMIQEMPAGVIIYNKNREILKANRIASEFYSFRDESEMIGKIFPETSLSEDNDYFSKHLGGAFSPEQFVIIKKEIGEVVLYRSSIPIKYLGEDVILEILIDITLLESARKQEAQANVAKSEFLARMSYEIRTPLNGIIGMADVLNRFELTPDVKDIVHLLRRSTEVLLGIVNDILDFSKIESGKMILDETPFNIREEIFYAVDLAKTNIGEKDVEVTCLVDDKVPETIIGDPFRLRQILANIINHSVIYTERGKIILKCVVKGWESGVVTLLFEVMDTGKPFDKASLKKIFGDFVDADSIAVRGSDESGFATIIARQLVDLMGGELTAFSPSGLEGPLGKKVVFSIKVYSNERQPKSVDLSLIRKIEQIRTLVITGSQSRDEEFLSMLHKVKLQTSVTSFHKASVNQIKANLGAKTDKYSLLIICDDIDFDGFEAARSIHEANLSKEFIIFMVSSNDRKGNYLKCLNLGVDHYMVKPFDMNELIEMINISFTYILNDRAMSEIPAISRDLAILVVEDNKMNQIILSKMLSSLGYGCEIASDGYEGFQRAKSKKYDLIFMDLIMPEMDGYESTRRITEFDKSYLIVAFTADNMPESRKKAELSGIQDFISKPVRVEDLKRLFAKYFNT
ncbi:MAG TPA: response regulator [Bacteroidales bacterium]|nr:response regulator [Bacteroidales bacterium]